MCSFLVWQIEGKKIKYELNYKTTIYIMFEIYHYVEHYNKNNSEFLIPKEECATNIFFCYYDICTMYQPSLVMTTLCRGTCGAHKVGSPLLTEFSQYACVMNRTPDHMLKATKSLTQAWPKGSASWPIALSLHFLRASILFYFKPIIYRIA
jgi:hypothetical protein